MTSIATPGSTPSLRQRRHVQTRSDLVDAAFALFAQKGYAAVTMEEIAAAAGVSRSTAYRRFPTKDEVVLEILRRWQDAFDDAVAGLADDTPIEEALDTTMQAVANHIDANIDSVLAAYAVIDEAPGLRASGVATTDWQLRLVALLQRFGDFDDETAAIMAGAYLGALDAMMNRWAESPQSGSVSDATARVSARLVPLLRALRG